MKRSRQIVMFIFIIAAMCGCASSERVPADPLSAMPDDLTIELTVRSAAPAINETGAESRTPSAARFVLFPDGSLHYGSGDFAADDRLPPRLRTLSRSEVARLWSELRQSGLADPASGQLPRNTESLSPPIGGAVVMLTIRGDGERWMFLDHVVDDDGDQLDGALAQLHRSLSELAWVDERSLGKVRVMPRRYDFGPDPYERYRR